MTKNNKVNTELLQIMQNYVKFMDSEKSMVLPVVVSEPKKNHKSSLYYTSPLTAGSPLGESSFDCEIKDRDSLTYSFQILTDEFKSRVALRFDEGIATHYNNIPGIELTEQSVTAPHFHKYNEQGYFIAYKNEDLKQVVNYPMSLEDGFNAFCKEAKIKTGDVTPKIKIVEGGVIKMNLEQQDPLAGINF